MTAIILAVLLSSGPGARLFPGAPRSPVVTPHHIVISSSASMAGTFVAGGDSVLTTMHWATSAVGVGIGANQTIAVTANGTPVCSVVTPCTSAVGFEASATCNGNIPAGADVEFTRTGCALGISSGVLTYLLEQ